MTTNTAASAPISGFWRRLWTFVQSVELSSAEFQDLRIDALERQVARLQKDLEARASIPSSAPPVDSQNAQSSASRSVAQKPQKSHV